MQLTPLIAVHMSAALGAIALGPVALWARRGATQRPRLHRAFGYAWVTLMLVTALSAVFIRDYTMPNIAGYTPIHLLVPTVLFSLYGAFRKLFRGDVAGHAWIMRRLYLGACIVAGAFTLLPSRYLGGLVWGQLRGLLPILAGTPAWVWFLLAGLVALGASQLRDRRLGIARVALTPLALTSFSLWAASSAFARSPLAAEALWLWLLATVAVTGLLALAPTRASYDPLARRFHLPGSWIPLLLFVGIFLARYTVAVRLAMQPHLVMESSFVLPVALLYGAFSGAFLGRAAQLVRLTLRGELPAPATA